LSAAVRDHHATCVVAEALIAAATGAKTTEHCLKGERPRCAFHVASDPSFPGRPGWQPHDPAP
jgi:hypothetical protein